MIYAALLMNTGKVRFYRAKNRRSMYRVIDSKHGIYGYRYGYGNVRPGEHVWAMFRDNRNRSFETTKMPTTLVRRSSSRSFDTLTETLRYNPKVHFILLGEWPIFLKAVDNPATPAALRQFIAKKELCKAAKKL